MKYIARKILSFLLPIVVIASVLHGLAFGFVTLHFYTIAGSAFLLSMIQFGKFIRRIIFFPINILRKVLFKL